MSSEDEGCGAVGEDSGGEGHGNLCRLCGQDIKNEERPQSHTWRILIVPDWSLGGWGHS